MLKTLAVIVGIYLLNNLLALLLANSVIFQAPRPGYRDSANIIKIRADKHKIAAVYLKNRQAKYTILLSHGNAEDIGHMSSFIKQLYNHNFSVFAYDYAGYGLSTGKPTETNCYHDIDAAYNYLTTKRKIPPQQIIAYGRSVGTGPTVDLAARKPVAGVILQSPFVSAFRVVTHIPLLMFDKFNNLRKIPEIKAPILFIHGTHDRIIPLWHSKKLLKAATSKTEHLWVKGAGHNDLIYRAGNSFWQKLARFSQLLIKS